MATVKEITADEYEIIKGFYQKQDSFFRDYLRETLGPPKLSPLKSIEGQEREQEQLIEKCLKFRQDDIGRGLQLFIDACKNEESTIFNDILARAQLQSLALVEGKEITTFLIGSDFEWLDKIVERKFQSHNYEESSCMFRFMIQMNSFFVPAWVGWADSEKNLGHLEIVESIYDIAMESFPYNFYLVLFAADFYISYNQKNKAGLVLNKAKEKLIEEGMQSSKSFQAITKLLGKLA